MINEKITVLGGGTWGSTLATRLALNGHDICIWEFDPQVAKKLKIERTLATLPDLRLPDQIQVTNDIGEALKSRRIILSVTPSHTVRSTFQAAVNSKQLSKGTLIVNASKGLEKETNFRMSQVINEMFTDAGDIVILSGPSHAEEVSLGQPVALVAASTSGAASKKVQSLFSSETFRIYTSDDPVGVELGGGPEKRVCRGLRDYRRPQNGRQHQGRPDYEGAFGDHEAWDPA